MTELGEYLRACRARVSAEQAGIPSSGHRRVPGLRREELATLAGVSVDYIVRLEQGRAKSASPEILTALARALDPLCGGFPGAGGVQAAEQGQCLGTAVGTLV